MFLGHKHRDNSVFRQFDRGPIRECQFRNVVSLRWFLSSLDGQGLALRTPSNMNMTVLNFGGGFCLPRTAISVRLSLSAIIVTLLPASTISRSCLSSSGAHRRYVPFVLRIILQFATRRADG